MFYLGLARLLLDAALRICPQEITRSCLTSPWKTLSFPSLLLRLTRYNATTHKLIFQQRQTGADFAQKQPL